MSGVKELLIDQLRYQVFVLIKKVSSNAVQSGNSRIIAVLFQSVEEIISHTFSCCLKYQQFMIFCMFLGCFRVLVTAFETTFCLFFFKQK
jgi:hypothetical protein